MSANIVQLERQFDSYLARPRVKASVTEPLRQAAIRWSEAVWSQAQTEGPSALAAEEVQRGLEVAKRPIFIFGAHRSGTTLMRDLLDGHPAVAVLPAEGTFFTSLAPRLRRQPPGQWLSTVGCEWLRRIANPIHQQPYWLLGISTEQSSPYVAFARSLMAWWPLTEQHLGQVSSWPLVAVALAYAHSAGGFAARSGLRHWAEKTPTNERFLDRLRLEFPQARMIQVIRHPYAVYASDKHAQDFVDESFRHAMRVLFDLRTTYRVAREQSFGASEDYLLMRHEDLLERTAPAVERLATFLRIDAHPILLQPTVAGFPAPSNSSFTADAIPGRLYPVHQRWRDALTHADCERIAALVGESAKALGYDMPSIPPWRTWHWRLIAPIAARLP